MPNTTTSAPKQLSDQNAVGTLLGASVTDLIGFYGDTTPGAQPSGAAQAALSRGVGGGALAIAATSASPGGVLPNTTAEAGISLGQAAAAGTSATFQIASGDLIYISKPTSQAGLGIGNVRISGTNVAAVTFSNFTAATITATAGEKYGIVAIRGLPLISAALTPASVAAASTVEQQFTVTGLRAGEAVQVMKPTHQATLNVVGARVISANLLGITYANVSATTAVTPTAETYSVFSTGGIDTGANTIMVEQFGPAAFAGGASPATTTSFSMTMTGLATTDTVVGIMKPTAQAGVTPPGAFVSGVNALGVTYTNATAATVTPTTSEIYGVTIMRNSSAPPCAVYSATLAPTGVGPNTTLEQTFSGNAALTSVVSGSVIWVNKPTWTNGLGVAGARVSGTGSICITYTNTTAATIVPPTEAYLVANFQASPIPDNGSTWIFPVSPQNYQNAVLTNAIRAALGPAGVNLIAGV